ncbi:MAG TPA: DUF6036 family nucleotidyltransferase [Gaiellaceae bacterium]|nr:DUF6036 family nucleotidyltransferase [Gaiellaceae bacterium]
MADHRGGRGATLRREDFIHVLRAAADVVDDELVVVGSQAILGSVDDPPAELLRSTEVDVYPRSDPERAIEIDGAIGEGSRFHETYGYYAHGVGPETITAPAGWEQRLTKLAFPPIRRKGGAAITWCLSLPDLLLAKLAARRPHDLAFVEAALASGLADGDELERGVPLMPEHVREDVRVRLEGLLAKLERQN